VDAETPLRAQLRAELAGHDARLHEAESLEAARAAARELVGAAAVARWADPVLDGIAAQEAEPAAAEVSLVVADVAVAQTGTVALRHGAGRPRAVGLLPTRQVALLPASGLVADMAAALERFLVDDPPSNVVFVAGPSRTADIEQRTILGVHAPRELDVILYDD
jgi:L-lactate utilization protein LutC